MASDHEAPPYYPLTGDNHAALVVIAAIIFLIYAVLSLVIKLLIRLQITSMRDFDIVLSVGAVLYVAQTTCVVAACNHGLGQRQDALSSDTLDQFHKLMYASRALAVLVLASTKISVCMLVRQIDSHGRLNTANHVVGAIIVVWAISGFLGTLFQCPMPEPWNIVSAKECPAAGRIYMYNGAMDILTDVALCILPVAMMWEVQTTSRKKMIVMALFGARIIVPITTIPSLGSAHAQFVHTSDATWLAVTSTIWTQIALGLSVITACIPSLKGIIDSLLGATAQAAIYAPYELKGGSHGRGIEVTAATHSSNLASPGNTGLKTGSAAAAKRRSVLVPPEWDGEREIRATYVRDESPGDDGSESVRKLTEGVIMVRDEFEIHYDEGSGSGSGSRRGRSRGGESQVSCEADYRM